MYLGETNSLSIYYYPALDSTEKPKVIFQLYGNNGLSMSSFILGTSKSKAADKECTSQFIVKLREYFNLAMGNPDQDNTTIQALETLSNEKMLYTAVDALELELPKHQIISSLKH